MEKGPWGASVGVCEGPGHTVSTVDRQSQSDARLIGTWFLQQETGDKAHEQHISAAGRDQDWRCQPYETSPQQTAARNNAPG